MKKLLSVVAILVLAGALLPVQSFAGLRGAFDPLTNISGFVNGAEQASLRYGNNRVSATAGTTERHFAMTTRSLTPGSETVRELWLHDNLSQAGQFAIYRKALLLDPAAVISYVDPAWSPNGKYLAYVKTDANITGSDIYVQEYSFSTSFASIVAVGAPILVASGAGNVVNRHPSWDPTGTSLVFESNSAGSFDLYLADVFPAVGTINRITFNNVRAEVQPAWAPDGVRVAYTSNEFGAFILKLIDVARDLSNPMDQTLWTSSNDRLAETNYANVSHLNPSWGTVPGEDVLYYDAPGNEDVNSVTHIWRLDLATQTKCQIFIDIYGDYDPDVSRITNTSRDGVKYNYVLFTSLGAAFGVNIWRGNYIQTCVTPLPMGITINPATWNLGSGGPVTVSMLQSAEMAAAGYQAQSFNGPLEGLRMRTSIIASPTMLGLPARVAPRCTPGGNPHPCEAPFPDYEDKNGYIDCRWDRRTMEARLVALGLVDQAVPVEVMAYSNVVGRQFRGFGYINIATSGLAGSAVRLVQNSPNPFNPKTNITFAVNKPGNVDLRVYNVRGELVKTLAKGWYPQGEHTLTWDGMTSTGRRAPSGMYFAKVTSNGATDKMKMMLME